MHAEFATVFPGQGSQYVGMTKEMRDGFPWTKEIFEEASDAIKVDLLKLCEEGPEEKLQLTFNAQPAILVTSHAWNQIARREFDFTPGATGGHSLGEYTAILSTGAMRLGDAVRLVRRRGELMQSAVPEGQGKMAAILGLSDDAVSELCKQASDGEHSLVVPANFNAPMQVVIAGHAGAVDRAADLASGKIPSLKARKVIPLKVSAPFHSPLMTPVAEQFEADLKGVLWANLNFPVVFNVDAKIRKEADIPTLLTAQIDHPVLWTHCVKELSQNGKHRFVEFGPGKVLTGLIKRILTTSDETKVYSIDSVEELKAFEKEIPK
jgi:[acyl-carrier-protein] S-malonyltransferase